MDRNVLAGKWKQLKGRAKQKWGALTDDELDSIEGDRDLLAGKLQEKYGYARERADEEIDRFINEPDDR
ncbi:MAG: CsbD family protein [Acidobacteria bacterium]|nr:CsbD family protein [Acidobacteriota bacterium]